MNLKTIAATVRKRWWVAAAVMAITVMSLVWTISANTRYEATAILLLAGPSITGETPGTDTEGGEAVALDARVVAEIAGGDTTRTSLGPSADGVEIAISASENGIIRVETVASTSSNLVEVARSLMVEIDRIVAELDASDPRRSAETRVLSEPRYVREREVVETDGSTRTESYAVGSVLLAIDDPLASASDNPYTASDGTLRVLEELVSTDQVINSVREEVGDDEASFEIVFQQRDAAPIAHVIASATSRESTMATLDAALAFLDGDLVTRQESAGADESTWISFQRLSLPTEAQVPEGSLRRPVATIIVLGLIASITLAVVVDVVATRWFEPRSPRIVGIVESDDAVATDEENRGKRQGRQRQA
jgi:hypothetical protein